MSQITVLTGPERRRRWSDEQRFNILAQAFAPGACVKEVARRHDVSTGLIYTWRRKLGSVPLEPERQEAADQGFAEAVMVEGAAPVAPSAAPAITIDLGRGKRVTIFASAPPTLAAAALKALR